MIYLKKKTFLNYITLSFAKMPPGVGGAYALWWSNILWSLKLLKILHLNFGMVLPELQKMAAKLSDIWYLFCRCVQSLTGYLVYFNQAVPSTHWSNEILGILWHPPHERRQISWFVLSFWWLRCEERSVCVNEERINLSKLREKKVLTRTKIQLCTLFRWGSKAFRN